MCAYIGMSAYIFFDASLQLFMKDGDANNIPEEIRIEALDPAIQL